MLRFNPDLIQFNSEFMTIYAGFITLLYCINYNLSKFNTEFIDLLRFNAVFITN